MLPAFKIPNKKIHGLIAVTFDQVRFVGTDAETGDLLFYEKFSTSKLKQFISQLDLKKENFKLIIVAVFEVEMEIEQMHAPAKKIPKMLKEKFDELQIPSYFIPFWDLNYISLLVASNCVLQIGETVLIIFACQHASQCNELKFTSSGYEYIRRENIEFDPKAEPATIRKEIIKDSNPKKIILYNVNCEIRLDKILKSKKLTVMNRGPPSYYEKVLPEISAWFFDRSHVKFHILPVFGEHLEFRVSYGREYETLLTIGHLEKVPFSKNVKIPRTVIDCVGFYGEDVTDGMKIGAPFSVQPECHYMTVKYAIDEDNFTTDRLLGCTDAKIELFLEDLDKTDFKIPVIGIWHNSSVIACHDDFDGYLFLPSWGGLYGNELMISFDEEKPKFGKDAWKMLGIKNSSVVYDLLSIMSTPANEIQDNPKWGFKINKTERGYPVLIEFENFDGTRKAQSPAFLMAMLLKQHVRKIKKEVGKKPDELGFFFFDVSNFTDGEMQRIETGMKEACEMLKIKFVSVKI